MKRVETNMLLLFVISVTQFHLLRNITDFYALLWVLCLISSVALSVSNYGKLNRIETYFVTSVLIVFFVPLVGVVSGLLQSKYDEQSVFTGILRLFFALPLYIGILVLPRDYGKLKYVSLIATLWTIAASISIIYQMKFGPIEWFAESSERAGLPRYASIFGSLTAYGIACGFGIITASIAIRSTYIFSIIVAFICLGAVLSLQKAAILNVIIGLVLGLYVRKISFSELIKFALLAAIFMFSLMQYYSDEAVAFIESVRVFDNDDYNTSGDDSIIQSALLRIFDLPALAIENVGVDSMIFGIGPIGGGGQFGYTGVHNSHNGFVDLFLVGGIPFFLIFIFLNVRLFCFLLQVGALKDRIRVVFLYTLISVLLNMLFSGLLIYTPSIAMFTAISLFALSFNHSVLLENKK